MSRLKAAQEEKSASIVATVGSPPGTRQYADFLDGSGNSVPSNEELKLQQARENEKSLRIHIETTEITGTMTTIESNGSTMRKEDDLDNDENSKNGNNSTIASKLSNVSKSSLKASTYSNDRVPNQPGMAATYTSEYYESATRGSIDETSHISKKSRKRSDYGSNKKSKKKSIDGFDGKHDTGQATQAQTWTNRYTSMMIDQKRVGGWDELFNIEKLFELNMIGEQEYLDRKQKLINQLTGTKLNKESQARFNDMFVKAQEPIVKRRLGETDIIKQVPNWPEIKQERAICHSCHIVDNKEEWTQEMVLVKMAPNPFNNGTLRYVYYMMDLGTLPILLNENDEKNNSNSNDLSSSMTHVSKTANFRSKFFNNSNNSHNSNNNSDSNHVSSNTESSKTMGSRKQSKKGTRYYGKNKIVTTETSPQPKTSPNTNSDLPNSPHRHYTASHGHGPGTTQQAITAAHSLVTPLPATHVAKISIDPMEGREAYFEDVAMQKHAQRFADMFNTYEVPKKVGFLDCWVYELVDRTPHIYCGVEKYIEGDYNKYTNNWDWANVERSTPQAFSHFTYEASDHKILVCDLQGVGDLYTDPQMHTFDGKGCGKGNMGQRGIDKFLSSHRCNAICKYLKLKITNPQSAVQGTLPNKQYMQHKTIDTLPVSTQYTIPDTSATTSLLPSKVQESDDDDSEQMQYFPAIINNDEKEGTKCKCCVIL